MIIEPSKINPLVQVIRKESYASIVEPSVRKKRVATYCRVSTDMYTQQSSLETQLRSFCEYIETQPDWEFAGAYVDEGISGTNVLKRNEFMRMISDCENGNIDIILTKSISRFARNTLECLHYVRLLKDIKVSVYFEKERIDTMNTVSEILLSILAAVAQEESHNISENQKWSFRKRAEAGQASWTPLFGYRKCGSQDYIIVEKEAHAVISMFKSYAYGSSLPEIVRSLQEQGVRCGKGGKWQATRVSEILSNERYTGDIRMQKYYKPNFLSHKAVKNDCSILPSYYVSNHHPAIITHELYDIVQEIRIMKDKHYGSLQYPYYGILICPICGERMIRFIPPNRPRGAAWTCSMRCTDYMFLEAYIDEVVRNSYDKLEKDCILDYAKKRGDTLLESAKLAIEWKEKLPLSKRIEYIHLYGVIEKITFSDWHTAEVHWKWGLKNVISLKYRHLSDVPIIQALSDDQKEILGGNDIGSRQIRRGFNNRFKRGLLLQTKENARRPIVYGHDSKSDAARRHREM